MVAIARPAPHCGHLTFRPTIEAAFGPHAIQDDELRMMFSCVNPRLAEGAQVAVILQILCGFSVGEIAGALFPRRALAAMSASSKNCRLAWAQHSAAVIAP